MANRKLSIFLKAKQNLYSYRCLYPTKKHYDEFIEKFSGSNLISIFDPDAEIEVPDYLRGAKLLCYRDIREDFDAQAHAECTEESCENNFYNNQLTGITDTGIFFWTYYEEAGGVCIHHLWEDIKSVEATDDVIIFHGKKDFALPAISVCEESLMENEKDFNIFIDALDHMANPDRVEKTISHPERGAGPDKADAGHEKEKARKVATIITALAKHAETRGTADEQKVNKPDMTKDNFDVTVTDKNVGEVLSQGKRAGTVKFETDVLPKLEAEMKKLGRLTEKAGSLKPSELGSSEEIRQLSERLNKQLENMELPLKNMKKVRETWAAKAEGLLKKAFSANVRIVYGPQGFSVTTGRNSRESGAGIYFWPSIKPMDETRDTSHLPDDIAADILAEAEALAFHGKQYAHCICRVWQEVAKVKEIVNVKPGISVESLMRNAKSSLVSAENVAKQYETCQKELAEAKALTDKLRKQADELMASITEIDPVLTSFSCPQNGVYDQNWLERVKKAANNRETMPYLPLSWDGERFGTLFNWRKAVEAGRPNLFIEAETDEGIEGRTDMLDNFVATMLLAFPVKQLHFTVLEYSPVNTFVGKMLPTKVCEVFDAQSDTEAIKTFKGRITDMYREIRDISDCSPREIIVICGFGKRDRVFTDLMTQMKPIIENGRRAGIYFAVVLSEDITKYDWKGADANDFEQFFTPYSTILTSKKDKIGNPIPDYGLLQNRKAVIDTEEGMKEGTLAELIAAYADKDASTVPNKVYGPIESGELYKAQPVKDLEDQPKKDAGKLVVPIAESKNGETINLQFDDKDFISCFILGRSGMGKSFTLHTILTNMMLKYDPSTVEFILMDFKPGGVEMNYYKDVPHVKSLLVNGADRQVAGEILMSIEKEMTRRGDVFQECGVSSIGRYNTYAAKNGLEPMKHVVMLVDECQDLFKVENPNSDTNIVTDIARKGRSYGIHMVLATQTLQKTDIPGDALAQFSDFLFMGCKDDDVMKCEIKDRDVIKSVGQLVRGEVIYCHRSAAPVHGYVYNFAGKGDVYKNKTHENLLSSSRFSRPKEKQFYFNASQIYQFDEAELKALTRSAEAGLRPTAMSALGKNLSVKSDTYYNKFGRADGTNLLILGANNLLQAERVLWNSAVSVYDCNKALGLGARYYIVPNMPEDVDAEARNVHSARMNMLRLFSRRPGVTLMEEDERAEIIERIAATVRGRKALAETDRKAVNDLDSIFLIIPNQQLFYTKMARRPKGLESLDDNITASPQIEEPARAADSSDALGGLGFADINLSFDSVAAPARTSAGIDSGTPGRDLDEELRYILENGPEVNVHVILQTTAPDKIYSGDVMREKEMTLLFNDIVFLKMLQAGSMSLPIDPRHAETLSADPKSLRAIVYNSSRGERTVIPFDFPTLK